MGTIDYGPKMGPSRSVMTKQSFGADGRSMSPKVHMYQDNPGVYYDSHGTEVPAVVAKMAGYDVADMARLRAIKDEQNRILDIYKAYTAPNAPTEVEEIRPQGHRLVRVGPDLYHVEKATGERVTSVEMSRLYALAWLDDLDPKGAAESDWAMPAEMETPLSFRAGTFSKEPAAEMDADAL